VRHDRTHPEAVLADLFTEPPYDPKQLRLSDRMHRVWIGLLCVASKHDGKLPSMEDCALMLRLPPERMAEALA